MLCEPRDTLEKSKGHLQGQTTACFWACGHLCLPTLSQARTFPITLWSLFQHRGVWTRTERENTKRFPNNTFLSTTQTQQGQNEWRCPLIVKVKVLETHAEFRAAPHEECPRPPICTKLAAHPMVGPIQMELDGHIQGAAVTGQCHHVQVSW